MFDGRRRTPRGCATPMICAISVMKASMKFSQAHGPIPYCSARRDLLKGRGFSSILDLADVHIHDVRAAKKIS